MIREKLADQMLNLALSKGGSWSELFLEETVRNTANFSDSRVRNISRQELVGAGLRVVVEKKEHYGYTNDITPGGLEKLAREVADSVGRERSHAVVERDSSARQEAGGQAPQGGWEERIALLRSADDVARKVSPKVIQVNADFLDEVQRVVVANSDGLFQTDVRPRGRFSLTVVASEGEIRQMGYEAPGALKGCEFFKTLDVARLAVEAAETAVRMLSSDYAPKGKMSVIIDAGFGGVIFHEACGHLLEASAVAKKATVLGEKLGQVIAAPCVSAIDDGTLDREWGSTAMDDEGVATRRNVLIEKGVLKSFLVDRLNGDRIGLPSTGSARRQSYRFAPTSRMNNTFILPGKERLEDMIAATDFGLYAKKMGGGSVNPATGEFNFAVTEGYLIRGGKIVSPVRGAVLIGRGEEILRNIDLVGSELRLAQGMCGAASGWVPVDVGQPAIRVQDLLVGGR